MLVISISVEYLLLENVEQLCNMESRSSVTGILVHLAIVSVSKACLIELGGIEDLLEERVSLLPRNV